MNKNKHTFGKVLLLEDDYTLSEIIQESLEEEGYKVIPAYDGEEVFEKIYEHSFDIFLFDVKVPFKNGFDILNELRNDNNFTPTIFITSLSSIEDLSKAYTIGCDDYLRKPFELEELKFRIQTLLKRNLIQRIATDKVHIFDDIYFEFQKNKLSSKDSSTILTPKESKILKALLKNRNEIVSNDILFKTAWDYNDEYSEESLRTHIKALRKLLGKDKILNFRAQGYMLC